MSKGTEYAIVGMVGLLAPVAAMREPTRGCLAAGVELVECWHPDIPPGEKPVRVAVVFDGVIDAARKEGQE